ncbi:MAG: xanthine dehydrogenase accessory protein XdhC [Beijerinckiaceae bacterium]
MMSLAPQLARWIASGEPVIIVTIAGAVGSTPREAGATMLATPSATLGSIGGGQLEFHAIDVAHAMISDGEAERTLELPLGPQLGQCCGGRVTIALKRAGASDIAALRAADAEASAREPPIIVCGAGHTGRALVKLLAAMPAKASLIDDREGVFDGLPDNIRCERLDDPGDAVAAAEPGSAFVILTHSHALDYRLADQALARGDAAYVGMIGSATKRARFEKWFLQRGGTKDALQRFTCPIGGAGVSDKRPEVIAALTLGELVRALFAGGRATMEGEGRNGRAA